MNTFAAFLFLSAWFTARAGSPEADLSVTKTDTVATAVAGESVTYTVTASNAGPSAAVGARVQDTLPAALTANWTCVGEGGGTCTASGSGNIDDVVDIPSGDSVTYTINADVAPDATGSLANTATVSPPGGTSDPVPGNNSATDTDTLVQTADLSVIVTIEPTNVDPMDVLTWTVTVANAGPSDTDALVTDAGPAFFGHVDWTCAGAEGGACTASGVLGISDTVDLPAGGSVTYTLEGTLSDHAAGTLDYTATVSAIAPANDPVSGNDTASDSATVTPWANLHMANSDGVTTLANGDESTWVIVASNSGPVGVTDAHVEIPVPATLTDVSWTCHGASGGACGAASGTGPVDDSGVDLPKDASALWEFTGTSTSTHDAVVVTATITSDVFDPNDQNNTATDTDTHFAIYDVALALVPSTDTPDPGFRMGFDLDVTNQGPEIAPEVVVEVTFPEELETPGGDLACTTDEDVVTCTFTELGIDQTQTVTLFATIADSTAAGTVLVAEAELVGPDANANDDDDLASATVTVAEEPDTDDTGDDEPTCGCQAAPSAGLPALLIALAAFRRRVVRTG